MRGAHEVTFVAVVGALAALDAGCARQAAPPRSPAPAESASSTSNADPPPSRSLRAGWHPGGFPPDCSTPKYPCSEVGSGELSLADVEHERDEVGIVRPRDYVAEFHARHGSLTNEAVEAALRENSRSFKPCELAGTALVRIIVNVGGEVTSATMVRAQLHHGTEACLLRGISRIRFPSPDAPAELLVPFVFRSR